MDQFYSLNMLVDTDQLMDEVCVRVWARMPLCARVQSCVCVCVRARVRVRAMPCVRVFVVCASVV